MSPRKVAGEWEQWGVFHSYAAAHEAVKKLKPGLVRYRSAGPGLVEVRVRIDKPGGAAPQGRGDEEGA